MLRNLQTGLLPTLEKFIRKLQKIPYLASKNVYRVAIHFLEASDSEIEQFCDILLHARKNLHRCKICFNWSEQDHLCGICRLPRRDKKVLCVVETWHDLMALERAGGYDGVYHVLGGALCPLEGIGPDELTIKQLLIRISSEEFNEVIFATNQTPEGEATSNFILSKIENKNIKASKLASGVPIGSNLEYMDRVTIYKALLGRRPF